ncbi:MAG: sulfotransferase [Exilibacterium sp.]
MSDTRKIFVVGLPRTGTTSVCVAAVQAGLPTAHTAYTQQCFEHAQFLSDTPCFSHYAHLASRYPDSKFILLCREERAWLASIKRLLARMLAIAPHQDSFAHLNKGNKVMAWRDFNSPLKVPSTRNGKVDNLDSWWQS